MSQEVAYYSLIGGEDLVTPPTQVDPGAILFSQNYEAGDSGGYTRLRGYERFDGRVKPSDATFVTFEFDAGDNVPAVNDAVSGSISGFTGRVAGINLVSGSWAGNDATGYIALHNTNGIFVNNDVLTNTTQTNTLATLDGSSLDQYAPTDTLYDTWLHAVIEWRRSQIAVVAGEGNILGIWQYNGIKYAFRNVVGSATAKMFKNTTSGWTEVDLGQQVAFTLGTEPPAVGAVLTRGAATGVCTGYRLTSGSWLSDNAAGVLYFHTLVGVFAAGNVTYTGGQVTIAGASSAITLPPGGRYEFVNFNFIGLASGKTMYGVNGVGFAFSYNGSGLSFIDYNNGGSIYPTHIAAHKFHLFLSYSSSVIHSDIGEPYSITAAGGGFELATGDVITGFDNQPGDVLAIFSRNSTRLLYGTSDADWNLVDHSLTSGAREWTIQHLGTSRYLDDRGLTQLNAVLEFGDFKENTFSQKVEPLIKDKMGDEQCSMIIREKDQYRLFYNDGTGIICRVESQDTFPQFTRLYFPDYVMCCTSGENSSGEEELFFGSDNGMVYQMDVGTSCDGAEIEYILRLPFNNLKSPRNKKRYFKAIMEIDAPEGATLYFTPDFSYGSSFYPKAVTQTLDVQSGGAYWGDNMTWASFIWGAETPNNAEAYIDGSGENMAFLIRGESIYEEPHTITSVLLQYTVRGLKR